MSFIILPLSGEALELICHIILVHLSYSVNPFLSHYLLIIDTCRPWINLESRLTPHLNMFSLPLALTDGGVLSCPLRSIRLLFSLHPVYEAS